MSTTAKPARTVIEDYVAALAAGDIDAVRASFAEDASWTLHGSLPLSGTWRGRDTIIDDFLSGALAYYEPGSIEFDVTSLIADGDVVAMEWTTRSRTRDGKPYVNGCIGVF